MAFPDIHTFPKCSPERYERQMGTILERVLSLFTAWMPDRESNAAVLKLVETPERWSAGHAVFDEVRSRMLVADQSGEKLKQWQYSFEESCCKVIYNASDPRDPFDSGIAFFLVPGSLGLARLFEIPLTDILAVVTH